MLKEFNENDDWRATFARPLNKRMRDQELILRFLALYFGREGYQRPMNEFLNEFIGKNRHLQRIPIADLQDAFVPTVGLIHSVIGPRAFKPQGAFNAAVFDAMMVGVATVLSLDNEPDTDVLRSGYKELLKDERFSESTLRATADAQSVQTRIELAISAFSK